MSVTRPALSAASCSHCRSVLLGFLTSSAPRSAPLIRSPLLHTHASVVALPIRGFSSSKSTSSTPNTYHGQNARASDDGSETIDDDPAVDAATSSDVPWYLQVEPPTHVSPIVPQPLPEIPEGSPPLIGSLLEYASEEMGLDDLSLLDLRELDPPPALGANLFMLFGTARSERHLHVSAGRLVRWLRVKHRVRADADGLLGPNERKTKLRRIARRAKLLGTSGNDDADDGIRTGWICVNLGAVGQGGAESAIIGEDGRVSGFGVSQSGSSIVFQVMVESRRAELDLETLWTDALERSLSPSSKPPPPGDEDNVDVVERAILAKLHRPRGRKSQSGGVFSSFNQARFYSTQQSFSAATASLDPLNTLSAVELARVLAYDPYQKLRLLELLQVQLGEMDAPAVREALCRRPDGSLSTFLELTERVIHGLPPTRTWGFRLALQHKASVSRIPSPAESLNDLQSLVTELGIYGIQATRDQYVQLLSCIMHLMETQPTTFSLLLDVVKTMDQRGQPIIASDMIVTIIEEASKGAEDQWARELTERLERLLFLPHAPCPDEPSLLRLMTVHANNLRWPHVLDVWGVPARYLRARSATMYKHIFQLAAAHGTAGVCTKILRRCLPEMSNETPPVYMDRSLRNEILKCIKVADPRAPELAKLPEDARGHAGKLARREFVSLTRMLMSHQ